MVFRVARGNSRFLKRFNPRPVFPPGATVKIPGRKHASGIIMFQSSPGVSTGRNSTPSICSNAKERFNPRPVFPPGATRGQGRQRRHAGRGFNPRPASPPGATSRPNRPNACAMSGFNPRPASPPGATGSAGRTKSPAQVSILARRLHRAQPLSAWSKRQNTSFQSSPGVSTGRNRAGAGKLDGRGLRFNPRPASPPGATDRRNRQRRAPPGFNPRPASPPGATVNARLLNEKTNLIAPEQRLLICFRKNGSK